MPDSDPRLQRPGGRAATTRTGEDMSRVKRDNGCEKNGTEWLQVYLIYPSCVEFGNGRLARLLAHVHVQGLLGPTPPLSTPIRIEP